MKPQGPASENRRTRLLWGLILVFLLVLTAVVEFWIPSSSKKSGSPAPESSLRIVSLSPGVTQTIQALGRGDALVGMSDYCDFDGPGKEPLRVGSAITPHYEKIALTRPTHILTSDVKGEQLVPLEALAPTTSLPWLTLEEWTHSVERLGTILDRKSAARNLSARIKKALTTEVPLDAPRVLLALDYGDSGQNDIWFIRNDSIHGALLRAAGARNAVERPLLGPPKLTPEQLLEIDPDGIIVLLSDKAADHAVRSTTHLKKWKPLGAVRSGQVHSLAVPGALTVGPGVLELLPALRRLVARIEPLERPSPTEAQR